MAKKHSSFVCQECGWHTVKWVGRCPSCSAWGSLVEEVEKPLAAPSLAPTSPAMPITEVPTTAANKQPSGVEEFDRVLGGGFVPGAVILIAGEPGIGKSTLLLDVAGACARDAEKNGRAPVLYVSGEESASQVRLRAERIGAMHPNLMLASESDLRTVIGHVEALTPSLLVVDSIQTIVDPDVDGIAGGSAQVRAVAAAIVTVAKERGIPVMIVGHVTKDGSIAGPRVLEHLVDVVCQFDGERHSPLRMVRAVKNRYGATDEVGCFELREEGIVGLSDPSGLFLSARQHSVPGTCATITLEGRRPMAIEIQGLAVPTSSSARRTVSGVDSSRVAMMVAVLQSRLGFDLERCDIFVSTVGGARSMEPSNDAACTVALASAHMGLPVAPGVVAVGEVALTGELRQVTGIRQRLAEAARLGFRKAVVPPLPADVRRPAGIEICECKDMHEALAHVLPMQLKH